MNTKHNSCYNIKKYEKNKINGLEISKHINEKTRQLVSDLKEIYNITPTITIILVGHDPASELYVKKKNKLAYELGMIANIINHEDDISETDLLHEIEILNNDKNIHGILIQMPLPSHINTSNILLSISPKKDIDGLHPLNSGLLNTAKEVPYAIQEILAINLKKNSGNLSSNEKNGDNYTIINSNYSNNYHAINGNDNDINVNDSNNTDINNKNIKNNNGYNYSVNTNNSNDNDYYNYNYESSNIKIKKYGMLGKTVPYIPCTPLGCLYLIYLTLMKEKKNIASKNVAIFGNSNLVSKPMARLLLQSGATATTIHTRSKNFSPVIKNADIIITATGHELKLGNIKNSAILIDIGIHTVKGEKKICGDLDFSKLVKKHKITPVPFGVGPMTTATLMINSYLAGLRFAMQMQKQ